jgi:cell fate regulator YaaT (PSP1 superfamily)
MRYIGEFTHHPDMRFTSGSKLIIQTKRGIELGEQVPLTETGCAHAVARDKMESWVAQCGQDAYIFDAGRVLREATAADLAEYAHIQQGSREKRDFCQQVADRHGLPIRVVECECPFGGERIIFYFTAAERVDFRAMVKELAREYRTRIEMRQIGARDEARLLADFETCGHEVCCKVFLKTLKPISMRMAKLQKATLDPSQVSGRCGRLKCCLRYEHNSYEELDGKLPKNGVRIRTKHGEGVVVNRQVLTQLVQIRTDAQDALLTVAVDDITEVDVPPPTERKTPEKQPAPKTSGQRKGQRANNARKPEPKPSTEAPKKRQGPAREEDKTPSAESPKPTPPTESADEQPSRRRRRGRRRRPRKRRGKSGGENSTPGGNN